MKEIDKDFIGLVTAGSDNTQALYWHHELIKDILLGKTDSPSQAKFRDAYIACDKSEEFVNTQIIETDNFYRPIREKMRAGQQLWGWDYDRLFKYQWRQTVMDYGQAYLEYLGNENAPDKIARLIEARNKHLEVRTMVDGISDLDESALLQYIHKGLGDQVEHYGRICNKYYDTFEAIVKDENSRQKYERDANLDYNQLHQIYNGCQTSKQQFSQAEELTIKKESLLSVS